MPWPKTGATDYFTHLGLPDKSRAIKELVVCYNRDLESLDLQNGLALGCYQPSPEVLIVLISYKPSKVNIYMKQVLKNEQLDFGITFDMALKRIFSLYLKIIQMNS